MFRFLFALFAVLAMAFAAPNPNPATVLAGAPLAYSYGSVPVATYSTYGAAAVPAVYPATAYSYGTPLVLG